MHKVLKCIIEPLYYLDLRSNSQSCLLYNFYNAYSSENLKLDQLIIP